MSRVDRRHMKNCWNILGIEHTDDKKKIKRAYARLAKQYHPEEQSKQFVELSNAYKEALQYTQRQQSIEEKAQIVKKYETWEDRIVFNKQGYQKSIEKKKPAQVTIGNIDVEYEHDNISEDIMKEYLIKKINKMLNHDVTKQTLCNIFSHKKIIKFFEDEKFKKQVIKIVLSYGKNMDEISLVYLSETLKFYDYNEYDYKIYRYLKKQQFYKAIPGLLFMSVILVFLIIFNFAKNDNFLSPQQEQIQQRYLSNHRENMKKQMLNFSLNEYKPYLNGVGVIYDFGYKIVDESSKSLISIHFMSVKFTKSGLILLSGENGKYYIYDTLERKLKIEEYMFGVVVNVEEDGILQETEKILVEDIHGDKHLLDNRGNLWMKVVEDVNKESMHEIKKIIIKEGITISIEK